MICPTVDVNNLGTSDQQALANLFVDTPAPPSLILSGSPENFFKPLPILKSGARGNNFREIRT